MSETSKLKDPNLWNFLHDIEDIFVSSPIPTHRYTVDSSCRIGYISVRNTGKL